MRVERPVSEYDIELEKVKGEYRVLLWAIEAMVIVGVATLGIYAYLAHVST